MEDRWPILKVLMTMDCIEFGSKFKFPAIRLYDYNVDAATWLHSALLSIGVRAIDVFALHEQPWIKPIGGCRLTLRFGERDRGVVKVGEPFAFECIYSDEGWAELADKAQVLVNPRPGAFNWLSEEGEAKLLQSPDGRW
jgi:hypothetical protein